MLFQQYKYVGVPSLKFFIEKKFFLKSKREREIGILLTHPGFSQPHVVLD